MGTAPNNQPAGPGSCQPGSPLPCFVDTCWRVLHKPMPELGAARLSLCGAVPVAAGMCSFSAAKHVGVFETQTSEHCWHYATLSLYHARMRLLATARRPAHLLMP